MVGKFLPTMYLAAIFSAVGTGLAGCLSAPDLSALSKDPAPICLRVTSIYGSAEASRYHGCDANMVQMPSPAPAVKP